MGQPAPASNPLLQRQRASIGCSHTYLHACRSLILSPLATKSGFILRKQRPCAPHDAATGTYIPPYPRTLHSGTHRYHAHAPSRVHATMPSMPLMASHLAFASQLTAAALLPHWHAHSWLQKYARTRMWARSMNARRVRQSVSHESHAGPSLRCHHHLSRCCRIADLASLEEVAREAREAQMPKP